jgi:dTDP-glucose 4,6-dehydratase
MTDDQSTLDPGSTVLVTGGLGFIGSAVIRRLIAETDHRILNLDKVSYASTTASVEGAEASDRYRFLRCDLVDAAELGALVLAERPDAIVHLAAETHVDRSIDGPRAFLDSNVVGTFNLLEAARSLGSLRRFVHVSTDEVFGSLGVDDPKFDEDTPYDPRSPYSATKAASDHLVRAWGETYGLPISVTNCSNNYGPYQFPEKLIPLMIIKARRGEALPVYGQGTNVRDWLHVDDHAAALHAVMERGVNGRTYAIGGDSEMANLDVVRMICELVGDAGDAGDDITVDGVSSAGGPGGDELTSRIEFVADRPGHDVRYGVDSSRIQHELEWAPARAFAEGLAETVRWYMENEDWWGPLLAAAGGARRGLKEVS